MEQTKRVSISENVLLEIAGLMETVRDNQFEIGDRLIELVKQHDGRKAEVIADVAGRLNVNASLLYDYYRVSEKWSPAWRVVYQHLDWTIYRNSDPVEDKELLEKCIDEGWNVSRFKEEKFPALKEPEAIIQRIKTMINRFTNNKVAQEAYRGRIEIVLSELEDLLAEMQDWANNE